MAPAATVMRSVNPGKPGSANSGGAAGAGDAAESFENTLKRAGNTRDAAKADAPAQQQAIAVGEKEAQEPVTEETAETALERAVRELTQVLVAEASSTPVLDAAVPEVPPMELQEMPMKVCAEEMDFPTLPMASTEWSMPAVQEPAVREGVAPEIRENIPVQGFQADAQTGVFELDPAVMLAVNGGDTEVIDLKAMPAMQPVEMPAKQGDAGADQKPVQHGVFHSGKVEDPGDEPVEAFTSWVERSFAQGRANDDLASVGAAELASTEVGSSDLFRVEDSGKRVVTPLATEKPVPAAEARFAQENHPRIVTAVRSEMIGGGGKMEIRLDPPELGALAVKIELRDGVMTAAFSTSSDEATRLLSHSLSQLKNTLETQGISVEKLQVQQAPREEHSSRSGEDGGRQQQGGQDERESKQDQERREMLQRMWRRIAVGSDPVDLTA